MPIEPHALPDVAYSVAQSRELDRLAGSSFELPGDLLMDRAGRAAAALVRTGYPLAQRIAVVCGTGNNGGDGYVLARLLLEMRREVYVYAPDQALPTSGEAARACAAWQAAGGQMSIFGGALPEVDLVVDALFGIGLKRAPEGAHAALVAAMNAQSAPVLALDVPSGLDADTGATPGDAVRAHTTLSFIGLKQGLLTGRAPAFAGRVLVDSLDLPAVLFACVPPVVRLLKPALLNACLPRRARDAHKGHFGHVLVVGGDEGYGGAVRLAAEAAARVGAGLVSVATRPQHVAGILAARPELMVRGVSGPGELEPLLEKASVIVVGPGLGQSMWSQTLLAAVTERGLPTVMDADALNLLAQAACVLPEQVVITPHPGEAARLLDCTAAEIQADRYGSVQRLAEFFQATAVLKGAGTLVCDSPQQVSVCPIANPGLATGGTGDVLAGCVGGLLAQGLSAPEAARCAVLLHALAGEAAAADGERGLLAGDLLPHLRRLANPRTDVSAPSSFALPDEAATMALGARLAAVVGPGLICLEGDLGAGKTCLVRGLLRGLGYAGRVKSPTYTLVEPYATHKLAVSHWDLYRLGSADELDALGLRDASRDAELLLVEWPQRGGDRLAGADLTIRLEYAGEARRAQLRAGSARGESWLALLAGPGDLRPEASGGW